MATSSIRSATARPGSATGSRSTLAGLALFALGAVDLLGACSRDAGAATGDPAAASISSVADPQAAKAFLAAVDSAVGSPTTGAAPIPAFDPRASLAPMIEHVSPSVVSIHVEGHLRGGRVLGLGFPTEALPTAGSGSGFVVSADGLVVTNHHVVDGAEAVTVKTADKRELPAKVLGSDPLTDLAVLRLEGSPSIPPVELGDSTHARVGDWVVAIGSPMGLEHSASVGIISAKGRGSLGLYRDSYLDFLQTDADIAPGSSGGPLFDLQGRVVGINTAVGAGAAPGFAIPIDQAKAIVDRLAKDGRIIRGWLGAANGPDDGKGTGARVGRVYEGTPAASGGLREGDVITKVDGKPVVDFEDLRARIAELEPGHTALLEVTREGKTEELSVVLAERPASDRLDALRPSSPAAPPSLAPILPKAPSGGPRLGVSVAPQPGGLEVMKIETGSLAEKLGIEPGDLLRSVNGSEVASAEDVAAALAADPARVSVDVARDGSVVTLSMRTGS